MRSVLALVAMALALASPIAAATAPDSADQASTPAHPVQHSHPTTSPPTKPTHPEHPTKPTHPEHPAKPKHPEHPTKPKHPEHPTKKHPEHPTKKHPEHPTKPTHPTKPAHPKAGASVHLKDTDIKLMNFILTLEHMESSFFSQAMSKFTKDDFKGQPTLFARVKDLADQEAAHVAALKSALGHNAVSPCKYDFGKGLDSVESFLAVSRTLETVGASAYLGVGPMLSDPALIGTFGSIMANEARHSAILNEYEGASGFPTAFDTALDVKQVWTLAHGMIKPNTCGAKKAVLDDLVPFPELTIVTPEAAKGKDKSLSLKWTDHVAAKGHKGKKLPEPSAHGKLYAAFLNNNIPHYAALDISHEHGSASVQVPEGLVGATYILVTTSPDSLSDENTVAGPAINFF